MIKTQNLTLRFGERTLIKDLNFALSPSEILCILGPNGAGKSTLLKTLLGLITPAEGSVLWQEKDWLKMDPAQRAECAAAVFSETHVHGPITLLDFLSLGNKQSKTERINLLQKEFSHLAPYHLFNALSDGEKQRLSLLRALCQNPEVLYLDEPTSHLDPFYTLEFLNKIRGECDHNHRSFVWSTHRWNFALEHAHQVLVLWGNGKWWLGTPEDCRKQKILESLAEYKGMNNPQNLNWF